MNSLISSAARLVTPRSEHTIVFVVELGTVDQAMFSSSLVELQQIINDAAPTHVAMIHVSFHSRLSGLRHTGVREQERKERRLKNSPHLKLTTQTHSQVIQWSNVAVI